MFWTAGYAVGEWYRGPLRASPASCDSSGLALLPQGIDFGNAGYPWGIRKGEEPGQDLAAQLAKLEAAGCNKLFKEKHSGIDAGRPELKRCLECLREGDTLLVCCIARAAGDDYASKMDRIKSGVACKANFLNARPADCSRSGLTQGGLYCVTQTQAHPRNSLEWQSRPNCRKK
jgi:Resolvase, N terminal domain